MLPEDRTSRAFAQLLNECPRLGTAFLQSQLSSTDFTFGRAAHLETLGRSKPDILIYDNVGKLRVYVEAKLECRLQVVQLVRARGNLHRYTTPPFRICFLSTHHERVADPAAFDGLLDWFSRITWLEVYTHLEAHAQCMNEHECLKRFYSEVCENGAFKSRTPRLIQALRAPSDHNYAEAFTQLRTRLNGYTTIGSCGGRISPSFMVGRPQWETALGTTAVERICIDYHLPRYTQNERFSYSADERYVFCVPLWHDNDLPSIFDGDLELKMRRLRVLTSLIGGEWEIGGRTHYKDRSFCCGEPPSDAGSALVGLVHARHLVINAGASLSVAEAVYLLLGHVKVLSEALEETLKAS